MEHNSTFLAVLVPVLISRVPKVKVPMVVGEIIAGIAIGRSGFQAVEGDPQNDAVLQKAGAASASAFIARMAGIVIQNSCDENH